MIEVIGWLLLWVVVRSWKRRAAAQLERARAEKSSGLTMAIPGIHVARAGCGCSYDGLNPPRYCAAHEAMLGAMRR